MSTQGTTTGKSDLEEYAYTNVPPGIAGEDDTPEPIADPSAPAPGAKARVSPEPTADEPADDEERDDDKPRRSKGEEARAAIFAKSRQKKAEDDEEPETIEDFLPGGKAAGGEGAGGRPAEGGADKAAAPVELVTLKVDGREVRLPKTEVEEMGGVRAAQMTLAAQNRLREADRVLDELRSKTTGNQPAPAGQTKAGTADGGQPGKTGDRQDTSADPRKQRLRDIAERIQTGDPEDAEAALGEVVSEAAQSAMLATTEHFAIGEVKREFANASQWFSEEFSQVVADPIDSKAVLDRMVDEAREDMLRIGVTPENLKDLRDFDDYLHNYLTLRAAGYRDSQGKGLRSPREIMEASGNWVIEQRATSGVQYQRRATDGDSGSGRNSPARVTVDTRSRVAAKQGRSTQPVSAARTANLNRTAKPANDAQPARRGSDIVAEMKKARHQRTG